MILKSECSINNHKACTTIKNDKKQTIIKIIKN